MGNYTVSKCICHDRTFEEIKNFAADLDYRKVEELQEENYCSCKCGFCVPYIEVMLETGKTSFEPGAYLTKN